MRICGWRLRDRSERRNSVFSVTRSYAITILRLQAEPARPFTLNHDAGCVHFALNWIEYEDLHNESLAGFVVLHFFVGPSCYGDCCLLVCDVNCFVDFTVAVRNINRGSVSFDFCARWRACYSWTTMHLNWSCLRCGAEGDGKEGEVCCSLLVSCCVTCVFKCFRCNATRWFPF